MNCPRCGLSIEDALATTCPRCGQSLVEMAAERLPDSEAATDAIYEMPTLPTSGPIVPDAGISSGQNYGFAPFGQGAPAASGPMPLAGNAPLAPAPAMPPRKSRSGLIIGILIALVVILASGLGVSLYALAQKQQSANTGPAATATLAPTATATPNETVVFQDPLTSNTKGWSSDSHCFFQNGAYHVKDGYLCFAPTGEISDGSISVDAQQVSGPLDWGYGIVLRHVSQGNYYEFNITSDGTWDFSKVINGSRTHIVPFTLTSAIHQGLVTVNTLQVRAQGSHFVFFVNGIQVGEADDSMFTSGMSGVDGGGGGTEMAFNNFKISISS